MITKDTFLVSFNIQGEGISFNLENIKYNLYID